MQGKACLKRMALISAAAASLAACATVERPQGPYTNAAGQKIGKPYQIRGKTYVPREDPDYNEVGIASWYGDAFHLKSTANGEVFDMYAVSAAHTTLPLPSIVEVTNLANGRKLQVRVNDRGPFVDNRIIDLSREAARQLGLERQGVAKVRVRYVGAAQLLGRDAGVRVARAAPARAQAPQMASAAPPPKPRWAKPSPVASASVSYREQAAFTAAPAREVSVRRLDVLPTMPQSSPAATAGQAEGGAYRIQAGAFSDETRAVRAAAQLASVGRATVEPVERNGSTLYRVVVAGPQDELQAYNLRQRVADAGYGDAKVLGPF